MGGEVEPTSVPPLQERCTHVASDQSILLVYNGAQKKKKIGSHPCLSFRIIHPHVLICTCQDNEVRQNETNSLKCLLFACWFELMNSWNFKAWDVTPISLLLYGHQSRITPPTTRRRVRSGNLQCQQSTSCPQISKQVYILHVLTGGHRSHQGNIRNRVPTGRCLRLVEETRAKPTPCLRGELQNMRGGRHG